MVINVSHDIPNSSYLSKKSEQFPMISPVKLQINVNPKKNMNSPST